MSDTDAQKREPPCFSDLPIHAPVPVKQFESKFWNKYMAEQQVACIYTINNLLQLGKTLPRLLCSIAKFNENAFEAVGYRPFSDIPSYELPRRHVVGLEKLGYGVKGVSQNELRLRDPRDTKGYEEKNDFVCWVGRVTSPSHNRVTAGGRVVPVIPPPPRPAFANLVTPGSMAFGPSLQGGGAGQTAVPPRPYVPVPAGWEVVWIEDQVYLAPQQVGIPAPPHPYPVSSLSQPKLSNINYGSQRPLMNVTNAVVPQPQQAAMQQVVYHQPQLAGQQQPSTASQLQAELGVWNDYLRANYFEEQSRQARLRRVNGPTPKVVEPEATRENIRKWNGILASNGKDFLSTSRKVMNYGSPSTRTTRDRIEAPRLSPTVSVAKLDQLAGGGKIDTTDFSGSTARPAVLTHITGEDAANPEKITSHSGQIVVTDITDTTPIPADVVKGCDGAGRKVEKNRAELKEDQSLPVRVAAASEFASAVSNKLARGSLGVSEAKRTVPVSEKGKAAREAIAIFLQEQLKGRGAGVSRKIQKEKGVSGGATSSNDNKRTGNYDAFFY
ncbi:hypothetical protein FGG08_004375 [Glutinoglossum americanum]|uniref:Uncharacterized protein n=1 Tax=Glutinoglossum americanum TaxID=1670608 RepID=A0A9P8I596_9PEZI|nr:hypothetical protein FGG08_004375 [Glutinoglossum americanum]